MKKLFVIAAIGSLLSGCLPPGSDAPTGPDGAIESRYTDKGIYASRVDRTGYIQTTIHWARINPGTAVEATVAADEVLIGGGACLGNNSAVNAFLTGSYPVLGWNSTLGKIVATGWRAEAKEINGKNICVFAFAVGMKLRDRYHRFSPSLYIPKNEVQKYVQITTAISDYTAHPSATAYAPSGYDIVSGGARVYNHIDPDVTLASYLTGSYYNDAGNGTGSWTASAKDHLVSCPAKVISYAISIPKNNHTDQSIPIFGDIRATYHYCAQGTLGYWYNYVATSPNASGAILFRGTDWDWCPTGVGARTEYNGNGRMLKACYFYDNSYVYAGDQDYGSPDSGVLHIQRISIEVDDNEE